MRTEHGSHGVTSSVVRAFKSNPQSKSNGDQTIHLDQQSLQTKEQVSDALHSLTHYFCFTDRSIAHLFSSVT